MSRDSETIIAALKAIFRNQFTEEEYDNIATNGASLYEWDTLLNVFADMHADKIKYALGLENKRKKVAEKARSAELWESLCKTYPKFKGLGRVKVYLDQEGDLESEQISYYSGSRFDIKDEFDTTSTIQFRITDAKTMEDIIYLCFEMYIDTDIGDSKVYFSDPHVSLTTDIDRSKLSRRGLEPKWTRNAIYELIKEELAPRIDIAHEIECGLAREFPATGRLKKKRKT